MPRAPTASTSRHAQRARSGEGGKAARLGVEEAGWRVATNLRNCGAAVAPAHAPQAVRPLKRARRRSRQDASGPAGAAAQLSRTPVPRIMRARSGEVAEWSNAPDSKSGLRFYRNVGSNPTLSAIDLSYQRQRLDRSSRIAPLWRDFAFWGPNWFAATSRLLLDFERKSPAANFASSERRACNSRLLSG